MLGITRETLHHFQSLAGDEHQSEHLPGLDIIGEELDQFLSPVGLIEKRSVDGIQRDYHDVAGLRTWQRKILEVPGARSRRREGSAVGREFLKVCKAYGFAVFEKSEIFFAEAVDVAAGFVGDHDRNLNQDRLRAKFNLG